MLLLAGRNRNSSRRGRKASLQLEPWGKVVEGHELEPLTVTPTLVSGEW